MTADGCGALIIFEIPYTFSFYRKIIARQTSSQPLFQLQAHFDSLEYSLLLNRVCFTYIYVS